jgi:hypothetical protein
MSPQQLDDFIAAESALVAVQTKLWRTDSPWKAWQNLNERKEFGYGAALAALDFASIARVARNIV